MGGIFQNTLCIFTLNKLSMKPFVFELKETPSVDILDYSAIAYDSSLNLSIVIATGKPAINSLLLDTETFTRAGQEGSDSDKDAIATLLDTETRTYTRTEASDSDKDVRNISMLLDTSTITESRESVDQDK